MNLNVNALFKRPFAAILLILLAGIIVYANTFQVPFVFDDEISITKNSVIRNLDNFYANNEGYEFLPNRYVAYLTFALNYHFDGLNVSGYHAVNLFIHLIAALLVYALLRLTFRTPYFQEQGEDSRGGTQGSTCHAFIPLFAALLFVVHPIQTQAVTYIVQRITSLATMFYLLSVVLYVQARLSIEEARAGRQESEKTYSAALTRGRIKFGLLIAGSVLAAILAMKTKEISFTLPFAILLYEVCFFRGPWKRRLLYLLPLLATLPIVPMTILGIGGSTGDILADTGGKLQVGRGISRLDYLFTQFSVIVTYLRLLILPVKQNLDYDHPVYTTFFTPPVFLSFLLLAAIFASALYFFFVTRHRSSSTRKAADPALRLVVFGIFWFFLTLAVESSLIPIRDVIMEHRLYLPGFGAAVVFATIFYLMIEKLTKPVSAKLLASFATIVVLILGFATYQRNHVWGNAIRLWQDVVEKSPNKGRPYNNLGTSLEDAGRRPEALALLKRAIAVDPNYYKSYYNLADLYLVTDQPGAALPLLQTAIRLQPDFVEAYVSIGAALMRQGKFRQVITFLEQNLGRVGKDPEARFYLGAAYAFTGNREAAMRELAIVSRSDAALAADLAGLMGLNSNHAISNEHKSN